MAAPKLHRNVVALGLVSLLTDLSSEMIYPLLPGFLTRSLGAGPAAIGLIEGLAEATASMMKLASGTLSDRLGKKKPLVVLGYAIAAIAALAAALALDAHAPGHLDAAADFFVLGEREVAADPRAGRHRRGEAGCD